MSALPSPAEVAGVHAAVYETYYNLVDPKHHGQVGAMEAATFLKKSHLSDVILSKIWDMADPNSRGFLDKPGMFVALKLCALAQQGHNLSISNIYMDIAPPKMGDILNTVKSKPPVPSIPCPQSMPISAINSCWSISPLERAKYDLLFRSLEPVNGYIPGNKVKGVLMDSKLPLETLGKIWDLADMDKDGKLNQHEFIIAMHLVYKALEKNSVPSVLPAELVDTSGTNTTDPIIPKPQPLITSEPISTNISSPMLIKETAKSNEWVVSFEDQKNADKLFVQADEDLDGFVSGGEIKDIFFQSGLSQSVLAQIWSLCDISQSGKLNNEQFALSMWLIKQKLSGNELPTKLSPEMVPPSFRKKRSQSIIENNNVCGFSNPELDMISKDIAEIIREHHVLEQDISQKEADIKIKTGEIKSLQSELDTLAATLRQLDNQKGEAQKRLNDLKTQVDKLRQQATDQESTLQVHESELSSKRQEMECIKLAEQNLESQQQSHKNQLNTLSQQLQSIQLNISQTKANMTQLEEQQHQILDAITQYDAAFAIGDASVVPDSLLSFRAKLDRATYDIKGGSDVSTAKPLDNENKRDQFNNNNNATKDPFAPGFQSAKEPEPFAAFDDGPKKSYDPFNDEKAHEGNKPFADSRQVQDPFGEDPFAALHAPTRAESPSPALPPKKGKQPPPRPAPPRPAQGPQQGFSQPAPATTGPTAVAATADPFADNKVDPFKSSGSDAGFGEFADFANFDPKF